MTCQTIRRVDAILSKINTHPEYSSCVAKEKRAFLRKNAQAHSVELENRAKKNGVEIQTPNQVVEIAASGLEEAWKYLAEHGVDIHSLSRLGNLVDPESNPNPGFRRGSELNFGKFSAPESREIPGLIEGLVEFLDTTHYHPIIRASVAHSELVRIHPYGDGNGRISRLLQNFCLEERGYPSAIIPASDREIYIKLLDPVFEKRNERENSITHLGHDDELFNEFIASKVLASAESLNQELEHNRAYNVSLTKIKDPGVVQTVSRRIRGYGRRSTHGSVKVNVNKSRKSTKGAVLRVVGDIGLAEIQRELEMDSEKYGFRYEVKSIGC